MSDRKIKANAGDVNALYALAIMYGKGIGVEKNEEEATKWFRKLAAKGHAGAIAVLNKMRKGADGTLCRTAGLQLVRTS